MLFLRKPGIETIRGFLVRQSKLDFTYSAVGATSGNLPPGYAIDHSRIKLGEGESAYEAAKEALRNWDQFRLGWLEAGPEGTPIHKDAMVAILARTFGIWWLNACRIVLVIEEVGTVSRFGFAYGTLPDHAGTGEERFLVEWDQADDGVWFDILAFSRPHHILTRLAYPIVRMTQKRFGRESCRRMRESVRAKSANTES